jgi:hypothetical protein
MSKTLLIAAACLLAAALVLGLVLRPQTPTPIVIHADTPPAPSVAQPTATPVEPETDLAKNSPDPSLAGFVRSFRESSINSCKTSMTATLQNAANTAPAPDKVDGICTCATERVLGTITVGEARAAAASVVAGNVADNPAVQAIKSRFADAGKACIAASLAH